LTKKKKPAFERVLPKAYNDKLSAKGVGYAPDSVMFVDNSCYFNFTAELIKAEEKELAEKEAEAKLAAHYDYGAKFTKIRAQPSRILAWDFGEGNANAKNGSLAIKMDSNIMGLSDPQDTDFSEQLQKAGDLGDIDKSSSAMRLAASTALNKTLTDVSKKSSADITKLPAAPKVQMGNKNLTALSTYGSHAGK